MGSKEGNISLGYRISRAPAPIFAAALARCEKGVLTKLDLTPISAALKAGLVPLVHGDVTFDSAWGGTIASTEDVFVYLAQEMSPARILLAADVPGVYDPNQARREERARRREEKKQMSAEESSPLEPQALELLSVEERKVATDLLGYPKHSIGRLMTPQFVAIQQHWTVAEVLAHLRREERKRAAMNQLYVVDGHGQHDSTGSADRHPRFSPASDVLAFIRPDERGRDRPGRSRHLRAEGLADVHAPHSL
mgnify:CR=1 FL=1